MYEFTEIIDITEKTTKSILPMIMWAIKVILQMLTPRMCQITEKSMQITMNCATTIQNM